MPSDSGSAWSPPASNSERRLSNSSDGSAGSGYSKATSDSADFLGTRPHTAGVLPGKPAANPLQFVRVGPAELGSRAREQLRKAELAKRTEPKIERQEDWQSNLDNWKSSRRKRVEHIIERCVEVRRLENEPNQPRSKSKTFNEMLEERAGRRRRSHLALYTEDDGHDLSDLGIGTSSTKSSLSEDCDTHSLASDGVDLDKNHSDVDNLSNCDNNRKLGSSANEYDTCTTTTISSPEPEEYTYEGAIEGYKSRIISQTNSNILKTVVNNNFKGKSPEKQNGNGDLNRIRTTVSNKIEEKVFTFQQDKVNDVKNNNTAKKDLPKVDIHKRREQFERENSQESQSNKPKLPEITNKLSIKERLSSLEKFSEDSLTQKSTGDLTKLPVEVKPLKERLHSLEKVKSAVSEPEKVKRLSNGDLGNTKSLKERLSSLQTQKSEEEVKIPKTEVKEVSMSLKERLSSLNAAKNKEIPKISVEEEITYLETNGSKVQDKSLEKLNDSGSLKSSLSGIENQMMSFCRSLDSLDVNGQTSPSSFERAQSYEDFDCAEMQNNTVLSDIETEDSGIHTAQDSCAPADDIADLTQVASPIGEPNLIEISEYESSNEDNVIEPTKIEEPMERVTERIQSIIEDIIIEEVEEQDVSKADSDSASNYVQAVSQPEDLSVTEEVTEIQMDKDDEDTLKSLDNQDTSVSLNEPPSTASEGDTVVFEGKMTIHLNLNEICNNRTAGAGNSSNSTKPSSNPSNNPTNRKSMVTVSNITTTTNISPKNSIKSLKTNGNHSLTKLTNTFTPDSLIEQVCDNNKASCNSSITHSHNGTSFKDGDVSAKEGASAVLDALELAFQELDSEESCDHSAIEGVIAMDAKDKRVIDEDPMFDIKNVDKKITVTPLYENIDIFNQRVDATDAFPLDLPANVLEPPKEKPPPPPVEDTNDDELLGNGNFKHTSSARRIKKEIRNKRTSFLGIEGQVDGSYLDADLTLAPRPDITSFLQEETKIEKLMYKKSLSHDMDAKFRDSRDSGVDIDRGPSAEAWYKGSSPDTSTPHSRQNSEPYTHVTVTSDEEEAMKKNEQNFTSNLNTKLTELSEASHSPNNNSNIENLDKKLQEQQDTNEDWPDGQFDDAHTKDVLRFERELLQLEQEELRRQRENLLRDQNRIIQKSVQDVSLLQSPEKPPLRSRHKANSNHRHSMPNLSNEMALEEIKPKIVERPFDENFKRKPVVSEEHIQKCFGVQESRRVLYEDSRVCEAVRRPVPNVRPPQPIMPPRPKTRDSIEREITMRSSRVPSAGEPAPLQGYHAMTRHTLQALSAAPTPKLISNSDWMQGQMKSRKPVNYNYNQHWLVQEAEQRRIEEQRAKMRANQRRSYQLESQLPSTLSASQHNLSTDYNAAVRPEPRPEPRVEPRPDHRHVDDHRQLADDHRPEDKMLSVSGRRKCSHCGEELGRGAAMIIESLSLCYHVWCFVCGVCGAALGDRRGARGADVRVRAGRLHCQHCYSGADGSKYSRV